jgi:uncharacterized protein (DUF885 family)
LRRDNVKLVKRAVKWLAFILLGLLVAAAALGAHTWYAKPLSIDWFYTRVFLRFALDNPELLTQMRLLEPFGIHRHNARLADGSIAHQNEEFARLKHDYATLHRYDASRYTGQDLLSYRIFEYFVGMAVRGEPWRFHDYPVNQLFGIQSELPNLMTQVQQVNDATDADDYIARLGEFPRRLDQVIEAVAFREGRGIVPPKFVVEKVLAQIDALLATGVAGNPLVVGFREKLERIPPDRMGAAKRSELATRVAHAVETSVIPAYARLAAYFESLRPKATRNDGVWALPDGDRYYQYQVELNTTTTMTADEIHALGLSEVTRLTAQMDRLLAAAGYTEGTVGQRMRALAMEPAQQYPDSDEGRARLLVDYQAIIDEISAGLDPYFATRPKAKVVVKRVPALAEKTAPAAYYTPLRSTDRGRGCSSPTSTTSRRPPDSRCARRPITRRFPATTCRGRSRRSSRTCRFSAASFRSPPTAKAGRSTPSGSRGRRATRRIRSTTSAGCRPSSSAPCGSSSIPACTPSAGRASRRSTT